MVEVLHRIVGGIDRGLARMSGGDEFVLWIFRTSAIVLVIASAWLVRGPVFRAGGYLLLGIVWTLAVAAVAVVLLGAFKLTQRAVEARRAVIARRADERRVAERRRQAFRTQPYDAFDWGDPPPTKKQFGYARALGVELCDGLTRWSISDLLSEAEDKARENEPATRDQLRDIDRMHGVLPREITYGEAERVIEFLESEVDVDCPFCGDPICTDDQRCESCRKSLKKLRIPIKMSER